MRKLFYLFMVAMCATMFTACSDDDDKDPLDDDGEGKEGVITMTLEETYIHLGVETFNEGEIITIDWGDGNVEEFKSFKVYKDWDEDGEDEIHYVLSTDDDIEHEYSNKNPHIVTIKGNIKGLDCYYNNLTSLNVSGCTALIWLDCNITNLTSLDVSKNTALTYLICSSNNLTSLDVSKNTALTRLDCNITNLTSLDVSKNTELKYLNCSSNNLTSLDVSKNTKLTWLDCGSNNLTSLDVSKNTALIGLECHENNLTSLDVSKNTALTRLDCHENNLTSLDVSKNTELIYLNCSSNNLTSLDVSKNTKLTELYCHENNLTSAALNQIFRDLPQGQPSKSIIYINGNPGSNTCDKSIAKNKGWRVI